MTIKNPDIKYHGAGAVFSIYNPPVELDESSSAIIAVMSGERSDLNKIEVGWTVRQINVLVFKFLCFSAFYYNLI